MIASCLIARRSSQRIIFEQKRLKSALEFLPATSHLLSSRNEYLNQINVRDNLPYAVSSPDRRGLDDFHISESARNHLHSLRSVRNSILLGSENILPVLKSKFIAKSNEHKSFEDYLHRFSTSSSNLFIRNCMTGQNIRHDFSRSCCTVHRAHFSTSSKNPQNKTDKVVSTQEALSKVSDSMKTSTKGTAEKMWEQVQASIKSASMTIANFVVKLPGWTFYYATHPSELRQALHRLWEVIKHEAHHYWMGTKLLYADMQTARKLFGRTLQGSTLTRRERKQLLRTVSDLFRLVPFSMFIIIPFMEFALPFALRIFPNMLPSTFQDSLKAEENMKRELQSRIAMAQFFQETLQAMAKEQKSNAASRLENAVGSEKEKSVKQEQSAAAMLDFLGRARSGEILPADVIIQFASQFHDDLTLDNMPRMQLINMCRYMNIPPYGGDNFLRFQLRHKIRTLVEDDQRILWEGISSLTKMELREACQERGMRSTGLSKDAYREALQQWLDLSVNKNVPISLLIMSRIFFLSDELKSPVAHDDGRKAVAGLAEAISGLDQDIVNEVVLQVATSEEKKSDPEITKIKLEVIEAQNERILEEQQERAAASKKKEQEKEKQDVQVSANKVSESPSASEDIGSKDDTAVTQDMLSGESQGKVVDETKNIDDEFLSTQEMDAISQLISADPLTKEREELERIKAAMSSVIHEGDTERTVKNVPIENGDSNISEKLYIDQSMSEITVIDKKNIERSETEKMSASTTLKDAEVLNEVAASTNTAESKVGDAVTTENIDSTSEGEMDSTYASLKARVSRMVVKIESQLESVEEKIGDKLHFLDKDGDGILTLEEMADALQRVLKRSLSYDEAMAIAALMDENKDGFFTVNEFKKWIETSKIVQLVKKGQDGDLDRLLVKHSKSQKDDQQIP